MKKVLIISVLAVGAMFSDAFAQNSLDALRYSRSDYQGSARFIGMGSSFGALGGEISGLSINPGGLGVYRNSEFTASMGFNSFNSDINYRGTNREDGKINFNIPNIAYVGSYKGDANGWKNYSFAVNYNRSSTYNKESFLVGNSPNSTLIDDYVFTLNNNNASIQDVQNLAFPFGPSQAFNLLLIDTLTNPNTGNVDYIPYVFLDEFLGTGRQVENIAQERSIESRGSQSETQIAFGGNFQDRLYLGGSISFQRVYFEQDYTFREFYTYSPVAQPTDSFLVSSYEESNRLEVRGSGVNFKLGAIFKLSDQIRLGAAIHSPTFLGLNEVYLFDASSTFASGQSFRGDSITSNFEYRITTPTRYNLSLGYIVNANGAINVDYEYIDFRTARFNDKRSFSTDFSEQNEQIELGLNATHNVRIGGELKLSPFVLRAGFNLEGNPFNEEVFSIDESRKTYSVGGGFRNKNFNFDVGLNYRDVNTTDFVYSSSDASAIINETETNLVFTVGWRW